MMFVMPPHRGATSLVACVSLLPAMLHAASLLHTAHLAAAPPPNRPGDTPLWLAEPSERPGHRRANHHHQQQQHNHHHQQHQHQHHADQEATKQTLRVADGPSASGLTDHMATNLRPDSAHNDRMVFRSDNTRQRRRDYAYTSNRDTTVTQYDGSDHVDDEDDSEDDNSSADSQPPRPAQELDSRLHGRLTPCPGCQRITDTELAVGKSGIVEPTGNKLSDSQMKELLVERIKQQILAKLRLPFPPNTTRPINALPDPLVQSERMLADEAPGDGESLHDDPDDFYGKTTRMITFAKPVAGCPSGRSKTTCFHFDVAEKVNSLEVERAQLWVYKEADSRETLIFSNIVSSRHDNSSRVAKHVGAKEVAANQHWVAFDLKHTVQHWIINPHRNLGVSVSCKTCNNRWSTPIDTEQDHKPFIVIHTTAGHKVRKRSINDCGPNTGNRCCREPFVVDFLRVGWDWVSWPKEYTANYCKGTCFVESPILPRYQHTNIMQNYAYSTNNEDLSPCCAPRKMSYLTLIYADINGDFTYKHLPNMVVESCGCT